MERKTRLRDTLGLTATFLSALLVLGYCQFFKRQYDIFHVSVIPYLNQFHIVIQSGLYRNSDNNEMRRRIDQNVEEASIRFGSESPGPAWLYPTGMSEKAFDYIAWTKIGDYLDRPGEMADYALRTIRENRKEYVLYSLLKCWGLSTARSSHIVTPRDAPAKDAIRMKVAAGLNVLFAGYLKFGLVFAILLVEFCLLLRCFLIRFRQGPSVESLPWARILLWLWIAGAYVTALIGAQCD